MRGPDNVHVRELLKEGHLPQRRAGNSLILTLQANLFEGNDLARHCMTRLVDHAVGALTQLVGLDILVQAAGHGDFKQASFFRCPGTDLRETAAWSAQR